VQNYKPIRMCISCRMRNYQIDMMRLQILDDNIIIRYNNSGRSFYVCKECIGDKKKIKGLTKRFKQDEERFVKFLKEQLKNE